jgi:hypothetical protein
VSAERYANSVRVRQETVDTGYFGPTAKESSGDLEYDLARVYALCAAAAKEDAELAVRYGDRAMEFLRMSGQADLFKEAARAVSLAEERDFEALRERNDFREFLKTVQTRLR